MELNQEEVSEIVYRIIEDGRKYNLIDRFFHYKIERTNLYENISISNLSQENLQLDAREFLNKID